MQKRFVQLFFYLFSFGMVAFAQPDWSVVCCILASCVGYALFWKGMLFCETKKGRFFSALIWFAAVSAIHFNWFFSDRYLGIYIYPFLVWLFISLGIQFALISLFIHKNLNVYAMLGISGGWAVSEWIRLYALSGFSFDPVGLELTATLTGLQMASAVGVFGLSFWVFFTNLLAFRFIVKKSWGNGGVWAAVLATPYFFGTVQIGIHAHLMEKDNHKPLSALLVQTSMLPEEKCSINGSKPISPVQQWGHIFDLLLPHLNTQKPHDVILLPEGTVPYGTDYQIYPFEVVSQTFKAFFGDASFLPTPTSHRVGNSFWAQGLSNVSNSPVVVGLEMWDAQKAYNSAFLFRPFMTKTERYDKQILLPMGEYIPFEWCKKILSKYGIADSFSSGSQAQVFDIKNIPAGISICYEETYGNLMRNNRKKGAQMLMNLTNDVWMPRTRLPTVHFLHGRLRAVEAGVPMLRCCNTGLTCAVDALGRIVDQLPPECSARASEAGVLSVELPVYRYDTFYTLFGDQLIIGFSAFLFASFSIFLFFKRNRFILKVLNIYHLRKN